ncbi:hypothetical protein [Massilia sp. Dwa41.01b]|uniref:hypothetical protein n=1 Tax=Massilia sp. Dwa41.01b TaxID=2709302 RepID=UPI001E50023B|nr:hypothetical protein [Massilia sp. Dwa41.01b]
MTATKLHPTLLAAALLAAFPHAHAQSDPQAPGPEAAQSVVVIGSRGAPRSALDTAVPVAW